MLHQMCHEVLSAADINAIRKARGFKEKETASRTTFESFFLSSIGLEAAMAELTPKEVAALYLLSQQQDEVDIRFFERLYGNPGQKERYYYTTFTQQFRGILDSVKRLLLRRGLLVMAEAKQSGDSVQMERWRFRLPPEFAPFLPSLVPSPHRSEASGEQRAEVIRHKLVEAVGGSPVSRVTPGGRFDLSLTGGTLMMGDQPYSARVLAEWQQVVWQAELGVHVLDKSKSISLPAAVSLILDTLGAHEWATAKHIEPALEVFCFGVELPGALKICDAGWRWGCLVRCEESGQTYYRLPASSEIPPVELEPDVYLQVVNSSALIDLLTIPLDVLEQLNGLAYLEMVDGRLEASPDAIKLGRVAPDERQSPLSNWLYTHIPAFQEAFDAVSVSWGKTIVHSNVLVARVRDLSLRVQIERELGEHLVVIGDDIVVFPEGRRSEVERVIGKAGFVTKEVRA